MKKIIPIFLLLFISNSTAGVKVKIFKPALHVLWGIKKLAVAEFKSKDDTGNYITSLITKKLKQTQYFKILQQSEIEKKLQNTNLTADDLVNIAKAKESCTALNVDGIILDEITIYQIEPDERGVEKISKQIWTGEYERDEAGKIIEENIDGQLVKKKKFNTKTVKQGYRIRRGTVSISFNLVDGETGKLAISSTITKNYDSGKIADEDIKTLLPSAQILRILSIRVVNDFVKNISPKLVTVKREIESGDGFIDEGKTYAASGLWSEAIATWLKAERVFPNNPAVYYNLGLAHEAQGDYNKAEIYYKKATLLKDKKLYKKALKNLRKAREQKIKQLKKGKK